MSNLKVRILHIAHCTLLIAHSGARFHSHTFMAPTHVQSLEVFPLHEPTCHLSLVTGDLRMLFPIVTLFSISSYQLPVTSYKSQWFMVPIRRAPQTVMISVSLCARCASILAMY